MTKYSKAAVDAAIRRSREPISSREAAAIHRLLKGRQDPAPPPGDEVMSKERFIQGMAALGYNVNTANQVLGIGRSSIYRIARGTAAVPEVVRRLIDMYERFGIPEEHRS